MLFIHGFLDDQTVWDDVIASLEVDVNTVSYDLPGFGARVASVADPGDLSLEPSPLKRAKSSAVSTHL